MKKFLPTWVRSLLCACFLLSANTSAHASHIVGADLYYKWVGLTAADQTYQITVVLFGNCSSSSSVAFGTLPSSVPRVCIFDGAVPGSPAVISLDLPLIPYAPGVPGVEVTPVCPADSNLTQCHDLASLIPGIKKFVYTANVTLPHTSRFWRFVYEGYDGPAGSPAGRAGDITNLSVSSTMQLIDTLNNDLATNTRGHNSSPVLTVLPVPFFCDSTQQCYNPGAVDLYDVNPVNEPAGDDLKFSLIAATSGSGSTLCPAPGGPVGYVPPTIPSSPLTLSSGSLVFDTASGTMCFHPLIQRAVVVYNIEEFRDDTVAGIVYKRLVGTMQREMTFTVISCHNTSPTGYIDTVINATKVDSTHLYGCVNTGIFTIRTEPREPDTSLHITAVATGLPPGFLFFVTNNNTDSPHVSVTVNTGTVPPGTYTFYLNYYDDNCPLTGSKTTAITVQVLPVPTVRDSLISKATCADSAQYMIFPGGTGKPWTVKIWQYVTSPGDSFFVYTDSNNFVVNVAPGLDSIIIYTSVSNQCAVKIPFVVDTPHFHIDRSFISPDYCGGNDGCIAMQNLHPGKLDSIRYSRDGVIQPRVGFIVPPNGIDTLGGLLAGTYYLNIIEGLCVSDSIGWPVLLVNPPFTMGTVTGKNPTKCGFCDGIDTLFNLHPGQLDTIQYTFTPPVGSGGAVTYPTTSHFITSDSFIIFSGLCAGTYSNFVVQTAGRSTCSDSCCAVTLVAPPISDNFTTSVRYGCKADTVVLTNLSSPASELFFHWDFGDGAISTALNPSHVYTNTTNDSAHITLSITNTKCVDTTREAVYLNNYVHAGFSMLPDKFICQDSLVSFTNTSTGASPITNNPPTYLWIFGDGVTDNATFSPTHTFTNTNTYTIKLVAATTEPCYDTATQTLQVDSISVISISATDTVICRGQAITFKGIYTSIGQTGNAWSFGDANNIVNVNPVVHSYDDSGVETVTLNSFYRACPNVTSTRKIVVIPHPDLYLGPDRTICPGGNPVIITDDRNVPAPGTKWLWSTGDTSAGIVVTQPGYYSTMLTVNGCSSFDTVWVQKDCYMDIPNVFTPNGDGTNDYFYPRQFLTRGVVKFKMDIYNRWGQLIFETTNTDGRGWDGKYNDLAQPGGVYVYLIEATFKDGQVEHHQGNVTLLR